MIPVAAAPPVEPPGTFSSPRRVREKHVISKALTERAEYRPLPLMPVFPLSSAVFSAGWELRQFSTQLVISIFSMGCGTAAGYQFENAIAKRNVLQTFPRGRLLGDSLGTHPRVGRDLRRRKTVQSGGEPMSSLVMARSFRLVGVAGEIVGAGEAVLNNSRAEGTNLGIERLKGSVGRADDRRRTSARKKGRTGDTRGGSNQTPSTRGQSRVACCSVTKKTRAVDA